MTKIKNKLEDSVLIQRNYLVWVARDLLGMSFADIGTIFDLSRQAVYNILRREQGDRDK